MNNTTSRLYYIDWLRIVATIGIFFFHSSRAFDYGDWHIKNAQASMIAAQFVEFMNIWMMPLFFVLSGAAVYFSLRSRTGRGFIKERFFRIFIPWVLICVFIFSPPQVYLERLTHGQFTGSLYQFYPNAFDGLYGFGGNFAWMGLHGWYLMLLALFSIIFLPLLVNRTTGISFVKSLSQKLSKSWVLPLLWIPVGIAALLSGVAGLSWTEQMGSWDIFSYAMFFVLGYMLFSNEGWLAIIKKQGGWFLLAAVVFSIGHLVLRFNIQPPFYDEIDIRLLATWGWVVGLIWFGERLLNFTNRFLAHANEMVLPFYILHQAVIVVVAYFVVQTTLATGLKYAATAIASLAVILVLYELLVSRIGLLRFLFGMKKASRPAEPPVLEKVYT